MTNPSDMPNEYSPSAGFPAVVVRAALAHLLPADLLDECLEEELAAYFDEFAKRSAGDLAVRRGYVTPEALRAESENVDKQMAGADRQTVIQSGDIPEVSALISRLDLLEILRAQAQRARDGTFIPLAALAQEKGYVAPGPTEEQDRTQLPHIDGYEMLAVLGRGGMGTVYKARQLSMDRLVAIKVLHPERTRSPGFVRRFLKEARSVAKLNHPNIVGGIDCGQSGDTYYLVMEYVEGRPVSQVIRDQGRLPEPEALAITLQVARALEAARECGIIHRDIKPGNMLITDRGVVKLTDLGLVKVQSSNARDEDTLTSALTTVGTPQYLSPEQAKGQPVDTRSDIYSLGISLFTMLAGRFPFDGSPLEVIVKHITERMPRIREVCPDVSQATSELVRKMTAKLPEDRFQTPHEVQEAVAAILKGFGGSYAERLGHDEVLAQIQLGRTRTPPEESETAGTASLETVAAELTSTASPARETLRDLMELYAPTQTGPSGGTAAPEVGSRLASSSEGETGVDHDAPTPIAGTADEGRQGPPLLNEPRPGDVLLLAGAGGAALGIRLELDEALEIAIGRDPSFCNIVVEDPRVSPRHCTVTNEGSRTLVVDLGSDHGTFVNNRRVSTASLKPGDRLRIGDSTFQVGYGRP